MNVVMISIDFLGDRLTGRPKSPRAAVNVGNPTRRAASERMLLYQL